MFKGVVFQGLVRGFMFGFGRTNDPKCDMGFDSDTLSKNAHNNRKIEV